MSMMHWTHSSPQMIRILSPGQVVTINGTFLIRAAVEMFPERLPLYLRLYYLQFTSIERVDNAPKQYSCGHEQFPPRRHAGGD
eukprot:389485-Amphidinium_carterae.1